MFDPEDYEEITVCAIPDEGYRLKSFTYMVGLSYYFLDETDYTFWVPFKYYNDYVRSTEYLNDNYLISEDEIMQMKGTLTMGGNTYSMEPPVLQPFNTGNYTGTFKVDKPQKPGVKPVLTLQMGDVSLNAPLLVMKGDYNGYGKDTEVTQQAQSPSAAAPAPAGTSISKLKAGKGSVTVQWKKQAAATGGYQIQYSRYKDFRTAKTLTVSSDTAKKTVKKLSRHKRYYFRIRTFSKAGDQTSYSEWSARKSAKTK